MWVIENEDFKKGGFVQWDIPYRLKHFTTGKYFSINAGAFAMSDKKEDSTLFVFAPVASTIDRNNMIKRKYVPKDTFLQLQHHQSQGWVCLRASQD